MRTNGSPFRNLTCAAYAAGPFSASKLEIEVLDQERADGNDAHQRMQPPQQEGVALPGTQRRNAAHRRRRMHSSSHQRAPSGKWRWDFNLRLSGMQGTGVKFGCDGIHKAAPSFRNPRHCHSERSEGKDPAVRSPCFLSSCGSLPCLSFRSPPRRTEESASPRRPVH